MNKFKITFNISGEVVHTWRHARSPKEAYTMAVKGVMEEFEMSRSRVMGLPYEVNLVQGWVDKNGDRGEINQALKQKSSYNSEMLFDGYMERRRQKRLMVTRTLGGAAIIIILGVVLLMMARG